MATIKPRRGNGVPSGLSQYELALDPTNRRVYLGNAGGTGDLVASHITDYVASLNGTTGAVGVTGANGITFTISGNTLTASLTTTGVVAGACGSLTRVPTITVDAYGRITDISSSLISASVITNTDVSTTNTDYKVSLNNGTSTSSVLYDTAFTFNPFTNTLSIPSGGTLAFSGIGTLRHTGILTITSASDISGGGKTFTVAPFGGIVLAPTTSSGVIGSLPKLVLENKQDGEVVVSGANLRLATRDNGASTVGCNLIFEGDSDDTFETTLTATDPTADRTITLPNDSGTVALTKDVVTSVNGSTGTVGISAGSNITVTQTGNTYTIASTASGGLSWSAVTADRSLVAEEGVLANKSAGTLTLTLPTTAALGKVIRVSGMQNTWRIAQNASQKIHFGKTTTTTGVGGYLENSNAKDAVELVCCVADLEWNVISSIGNIVIV